MNKRLFFLLAGVVFVSGVVSIWNAKRSAKEVVMCGNSGQCGEEPQLEVDNEAVGTFLGEAVLPPEVDLSVDDSVGVVLGDKEPKGEKVIYVDLEKQTLKAYEGDRVILETLISSGKWGRTPPGEYEIWVKMRATLMSGGSGNDYYYLPNVPYTMFFYGDGVSKAAGYALHGAYWHNNFGHPMSHGCVNMREVDAKVIYDWASPRTDGNITYADAENTGTKIIIF